MGDTYAAMKAAMEVIDGLPPSPERIEMSGLTLVWVKARYGVSDQGGSWFFSIPVVVNDELPFGEIATVMKEDA